MDSSKSYIKVLIRTVRRVLYLYEVIVVWPVWSRTFRFRPFRSSQVHTDPVSGNIPSKIRLWTDTCRNCCISSFGIDGLSPLISFNVGHPFLIKGRVRWGTSVFSTVTTQDLLTVESTLKEFPVQYWLFLRLKVGTSYHNSDVLLSIPENLHPYTDLSISFERVLCVFQNDPGSIPPGKVNLDTKGGKSVFRLD